MDNAKIRKLLGQLHQNHSPDTRAAAEKKAMEAGFTISDLYQKMAMAEPYIECYRISALPSLPVPEHSHGFSEVLCCLSGFGGVFRVGQQQFRLQRGDIVLVPSGVAHAFEQEDSAVINQGIVFWLSDEYFRILTEVFPSFAAQKDIPPSGGVLRTSGTAWESLPDLFRGIAGETEIRTHGWEAAVSGMMTLLITQIGRASVDLGLIPRTEEKPELLDSILSYVETRLAQKITLEDTAKRFWVSQSTITHLFHEKMGVSFYKYVTRRRLTEAQSLMMEGMALEKVATRVGFGDYSAFYRAFKAECGVSPREFRNRKYEG